MHILALKGDRTEPPRVTLAQIPNFIIYVSTNVPLSISAHPQMLLFLEDYADELAPLRGTLADTYLWRIF